MARPGLPIRLLLVLLLAGVSAAGGEDALSAEVTFVTSKSVYVSAGRDDGVQAGDRVTILRDGAVIATAEVTDLSTHKSVCKILERTLEPQAGDVARVQATLSRGSAEPASPQKVSRNRKAARGRRSRQGVHGRIGLRYLVVADRVDGSSDYSQPALDLRVEGDRLGGSGWGFDADVRSRRTYRVLGDGTSSSDGRTRVYRMAVRREGTDDPWTLTVGRQYSPALAAISIFDGASAQYAHPHWAAGLFSGSQPDATDYGYSGEVREHGTYFQLHAEPGSRRRWELTTGLVGSYVDSEVNREFVYVQGHYSSRRLYAYLTQEVDYNRAWKAEEGASRLSATSTFATLRYQATRIFTAHAGYDNRRNVRLYRDRVTPVTEFDDTYRRGVWLGTSLLLRNRYRLGLDAKTSRRVEEENADTYTATFAVQRITRHNLDLRARGSRYTNARVEGSLASLDAGIDIGSRVHASIGGGTRHEDNLLTLPERSTVSWYGLDVDLALGRTWYLLFSAERTTGDLEQIDEFFSSVTYRF